MKVFIKNKLISLGGSSEVLNENQESIYKVKGKVLTFTKKKKMYDMEGNLLYTIRNKYWIAYTSKVMVYDADGVKVATIKKHRWSIDAKYKIEDCVDEMSIEGKIWGLESKIMRNEEVAATITRQFTLVNDAFTLEADEKDIPFMTALVIAFDNITDKREKNRKK